VRSIRFVHRRPPAALVVATLALFVALSGVSFAGTQATSANQTLSREIAGLQKQVGKLRATLAGVTRHGNVLRFSGMNVQIVNGRHKTGSTNGLGNLIIGYNAQAGSQTGSHNVVIGDAQTFTSYGGLLAGYGNAVTGPDDTVIGGYGNIAESTNNTITGGVDNTAANNATTISGGLHNLTNESASAIFGGCSNLTGGGPAPTFVCGNQDYFDAIFGGYANVAQAGIGGAVLGGNHNEAEAYNALVAGGYDNSVVDNTYTSESQFGGSKRSLDNNYNGVEVAGQTFTP
jgi:hypothetical protein